jgi:hypothetical protein
VSVAPIARWCTMPSGKMAQIWDHPQAEIEAEIDVSDFACPRTRPTRKFDEDALADLVQRSLEL